MSNNELTKVEALKLIPTVVDGEASDEDRRAFLDFIEDHSDVKRKYESMKKLKSVVDSRCPRERAPASLYRFVKDLDHLDQMKKQNDPPIYDVPEGESAKQYEESGNQKRTSEANILEVSFTTAVGILVLIAGWALTNFTGFANFNSPAKASYNVEKYAYEHFIKHKGKFVEPTIETASLGSAEIRMAADYDMSMTIPALQNAEFKGVVYTNFVPNYHAPMLQYHLPKQDQYIYIFAFKIDKLKKFGKLVRNQEAVKKCNKPKDFYIRNINGKQVVSWKWNEVWYAAVSNHDGNKLASLIKPLKYNPDKQ